MAMATCADKVAGKGTSFLVGDGAPATHDAAGFEALTYTQMGLLNNISGEIGKEAGTGEFEVLDADDICTFLTASKNGEITVTVGLSESDEGLLAVRALQGKNINTGFEIRTSKKGAEGTGMKPFSIFVQGKVRSSKLSIGGMSDVHKEAVTIVLEGAPVFRNAVDGTP